MSNQGSTLADLNSTPGMQVGYGGAPYNPYANIGQYPGMNGLPSPIQVGTKTANGYWNGSGWQPTNPLQPQQPPGLLGGGSGTPASGSGGTPAVPGGPGGGLRVVVGGDPSAVSSLPGGTPTTSPGNTAPGNPLGNAANLSQIPQPSPPVNATGFSSNSSPIPTNPAFARTYTGQIAATPVPGATSSQAVLNQIQANNQNRFAPVDQMLRQVQASAPQRAPFGLLGSH